MKNILTLSVVLLLTLGALALWDSPPQRLLEKGQIGTISSQQPPDIYLRNTTAKSYDNSGELNHIVTASNTKHYKEKQLTELNSPALQLKQDDGAQWHASANKGSSKENGETFELNGQVILKQYSQDQTLETEITTSALTLQPQLKQAASDEAVIMRTPEHNIKAVGLKANLEDKQVELLSNVQGEHRVE